MTTLKFKFGNLEFTPGLVSSLTTLLLLPVFVYLGFWQLHRMEEKQLWQHAIEKEQTAPLQLDEEIVTAAKNTKTLKDLNYHSLVVRGSFLHQPQFLLDNQIHDKRVGYHVISPFIPLNSDSIILVDRGWIPLGDNRDDLPSIQTPPGIITLQGRIQQPNHGLVLKSEKFNIHTIGAIRLQIVDFNELSTIFKPTLLNFILKLSEKSDHSFAIDTVNFDKQINRHLGYAIQWFTIALVVLIYYMVINIKRRKL